MKGNAKISPNDTYIFDEDDLEEFDDISLTSALKAASTDEDAGEPPVLEEPVSVVPENTMDDVSIDELLASMSEDYQHQSEKDLADSDLEDTGTHAALEVLIAPDVLFPKNKPD